MEWALLALIALVCAVLSFLQYRWTGELSRAEPALLRAGLNQQLHRLSQDFNSDIRENCASLAPGSNQISSVGVVNAARIQYEHWVSSHDHALFRRLALAVPDRSDLTLYAIDTPGAASHIEWPATWDSLRAAC